MEGINLSKLEYYKITLNNFEKYNGKKKKGYECIMLSCRFFDDAKIARLTSLQRLIYIRLLLIAGDFATSSIEVHPETIARSTGVPRQTIARSLISLEENQLLTIEKTDSLLEKNIKEEKRIKKKIITHEKIEDKILLDKNPTSQEKLNSKNESDYEKNLRKEIRDSYAKCYFERYGVEVIFNKDFNTKIKALSIRLGKEAIDVVKFYLTHNDGFYLKATHSIGLCLRDCESLRTQMLRGKAITSTTVRQFEKTQSTQEALEFIEKNGI